MAIEGERSDAEVIKDKPKRNNVIWLLVGAAVVFLIIFLYFATSVFKSQPNGSANSAQSNSATH